jgi:hypothetical protein
MSTSGRRTRTRYVPATTISDDQDINLRNTRHSITGLYQSTTVAH